MLPDASKDYVLRDYVEDASEEKYLEDAVEVEVVEKETEAVVGEEVAITSSTNKWWSSRGTAWICRWSMLSCSQCFSRPSRWGRVSRPRPGQLQNIM